MPGKHVRFAETNLLYSPLAFTPSPLNETSSLPSCSPPPSKPSSIFEHPPPPPSLSSSVSSSPFVPSPTEITETHVQLHPILHYTLSPVIDFDISSPPTSITTPHHHVLPEPAVYPPLAFLSLVCPDLPWPITVTPAFAFVTVLDVLVVLHRALRLAVHPDEYNALPSHEDKHKVNLAYEQRYVRIADPAAHDQEKKKGVKRVDFLMGRTRFLGLSRTAMGPGVWALNVA